MADDKFPTFRSIQGGKTGGEEETLPENDYVIVDIDDNEFFANGFLVFTPYHLAVMRDTNGKGAVPVICVPIGRVKVAELDDEVHDEEVVPF